MKRLLLIIQLIFSYYFISNAQNNLCDQANPFCTDSAYNFPAGVNAGTAQPGPDYGCLGSEPNPAWYYMQVGSSGHIEIYMHSIPQEDIDFACWGPFTDQTTPCVAQLTAGANTPTHWAPGPSPDYPSANMIDCSYSSSWEEWCYIPNAVTGQYYILLITNYSNSPCNIIFNQSDSGQVGAGATNCGILAPPISGDTVCVGQTINLHVNSPTSGATYSWTGPNGFSSTIINPTIPNATTAMSGTYSLIITIGTQVSPAVTCNVIVNPNPIISISPSNPSVCLGSSISLIPTSTVPFTWFTWSTGIQGTGGITVSPSTPTTYSISGTDQNGCSGTASITVTIAPDLTITATANPSTICIGQSTVISGTGGTTYTWQPVGLTGDSITVTPTATTTYSVSASDTMGCTGFTTVIVSIAPNITINASASPPSICIGQPSKLNANGGDTYIWDPGSISGNNITVNPLITTTYSVTGTSNAGCTGTNTVAVNVISTISITASADRYIICSGQTTALTGGGAANYLWQPDSLIGGSIIVSPAATTIYSVTGYDSGCTGTATVTIDVYHNPEIVINANIFKGCVVLPVKFSDLSNIPNANWYWDFGDEGYSYEQNPFHFFVDPGVYDVTLSIRNQYGCTSRLVWPEMISVYKRPYAYFVPNPENVSELEPTIFFNDQSLGTESWNWNFGDTNYLNNTSNLENPYHIYTDTGYYAVTLVAFTENGCTDTVRQNVHVEQNISYYVPNAFTPNKDGKNSYFTMQGEGINWSTFTMRIYNRWGQALFYTNNNEPGWDGTVKGNVATQGVYTYIISFTDLKLREHKIKGNVILIK